MPVPTIELLNHLISLGLLTSADVVFNELTITPVAGRNKNCAITIKGSRGLFIKQPLALEHDRVATLTREAQFYKLASEAAEFEQARPHIPTLLAFDESNTTLVTELIPTTLQQDWSSIELAERLGNALAKIHNLSSSLITAHPLFSSQLPWVFTLDNDLSQLTYSGPGGVWLREAIAQRPSVHATLNRLKHDWTYSSIIHGDIKPSNILQSSRAEHTAVIIDWELATVGDSAWDLAGVLSSYMYAIRMKSFATALTATPTDGQRFPPAINRFWNAYCKERRLDGPSSVALCAKTLRYSAARLTAFAFEHVFQQPADAAIAQAQQSSAFHLLWLADDMLTMPTYFSQFVT